MNISDVIYKLAQDRQIFHGEADFQHALAWKIHELYPDYQVRLEYRVPHISPATYIDIWVKHNNNIYAIELKYKTGKLEVNADEEHFLLKQHSALDTSRYDFLKDIQRLERVVADYPSATGYAILLTNVKGYWTPVVDRTTCDAKFRVHEGRKITGELDWSQHTSPGTKRTRERPVKLDGCYKISWRQYSSLTQKNVEFKYALVQVDPSLANEKRVSSNKQAQQDMTKKPSNMNYYIYENWVADGHKARIHLASCAFCNNGKGHHPGSGDRNGRWHGPFETLDSAMEAATSIGGKISQCKSCLHGSK